MVRSVGSSSYETPCTWQAGGSPLTQVDSGVQLPHSNEGKAIITLSESRVSRDESKGDDISLGPTGLLNSSFDSPFNLLHGRVAQDDDG